MVALFATARALAPALRTGARRTSTVVSSWGGDEGGGDGRSIGSPAPPRRPARDPRDRPYNKGGTGGASRGGDTRDTRRPRTPGGATGGSDRRSAPRSGGAADVPDDRRRGGGDEGPAWTRRERQPRHWDQFSHEEPDFVYGVSPVLAALKSQRRDPLYALYVSDSLDEAKRKDKDALRAIFELAEGLRIPVVRCPKDQLNQAVGSLDGQRPHQGFVLCAAPLLFRELGEDVEGDGLALNAYPPGAPPVWLVLDELSDPQNLGALLRTAAFLDAAGVITCTKNSAPLSAAVSKASSGAMEQMVVHAVDDMVTFLRASQLNGWRVLGAAGRNDALPLRSVATNEPTLLVLGSEGKGLRTNVIKACSGLVKIESKPRATRSAGDEDLDSLNVSVAGAILLYHLLGGAGAQAE